MTRGIVQDWNASEGWGVIGSDETRGGCLIELMQVALSGYKELTPGQVVEFDYEPVASDDEHAHQYRYRASHVTVAGDDPFVIDVPTSGISITATFIRACPECGARIVKQGGPGGQWQCARCGFEEELPPFPPPRGAITDPGQRPPGTRNLSFPDDEIVGTLEWVGSYSRERGPVLATGIVEVPEDQTISLDVHRVHSVEPSGDGWLIRGGGPPVDLQFVAGLPPDSIEVLRISAGIVPASFRFVPHLATGLRKLYLAHADLSDDALDHVAELTGLTYLQTFGNSFTDAGLQQLVALQHVEHLYLEEDTLSGAALGFASRLPHLTHLGLQDMSITDEELAELRAALPGVRVSQ